MVTDLDVRLRGLTSAQVWLSEGFLEQREAAFKSKDATTQKSVNVGKKEIRAWPG